MSLTERVGGTLEYMAPELFLNDSDNPYDSKDPRALDYWSLGIIIHELITRELPFKGSSREDLKASIIYTDPK